MSSTTPPQAIQSNQSTGALVGCLLDVSGSMRHVLETGNGDGRAIERLRAVLRAALKLARAEQRQNPKALMFVGIFGLKNEHTPVVDLCSLLEAFLDATNDAEYGRSGHERLIALANKKNVAHITEYIRTRLTEDQASILYMHLMQHPNKIQQFVDLIASPEEVRQMESVTEAASTTVGVAIGAVGGGLLGGPLGAAIGAGICGKAGKDDRLGATRFARNKTVDNSEAMKLARRICAEWWLDFQELIPRPVSDVIPFLERLQDHPSIGCNEEAGGRGLLDELRPHLYGGTPLPAAMRKALTVFCEHPDAYQRVLVMISDGNSTHGDPLPLADELKREKVIIAGVFLTNDNTIPRRQLHDQAPIHWPNSGQRKLFTMASKIAVTTHPIPALASIGWRVPSSGECALYVSVCSSDILEEFCSLLLSARFGSADALLDILGRVGLDNYIEDKHIKTLAKPSKQERDEKTCYAHAIAAVFNMAIRRIYGREEGYPTVAEIRDRVIKEFPPGPAGRNTKEVLKKTISWYPPLCYKSVNEDDARQAVLHRRPVLATFRLSDDGWNEFYSHGENAVTRGSVLTEAHMMLHRSLPDSGGHAVVLFRCDPHSLTFLNSWGREWGNNGTFSIANPAVLELNGAPKWARMCFYDVFWLESELTVGARQSYATEVNRVLCDRATQHPSILELEVQCPHCRDNAPIAEFTGHIYQAVCPLCHQPFKPEPGHLVQALYARAGLSDSL